MSAADAKTEGDAPNIMTRTVALQVSIGALGTRQRVDSQSVMTDAAPELLHIHKDILESDELKDISRHDGVTRGWVRSRALPSIFRNGIYLVPVKMLQEIDQFLVGRISERNDLVARFIQSYLAAKACAPERLKSLYCEADYPPVEALREKFYLEYRYVSFETPGTLSDVSREIFAREREKFKVDMRAAADEIKLLLRTQMKGLVDHMVERLSPREDGQPRVFRNTLVSNLAEFLETVDFRNVVDDEELRAISSRARALLRGVDAEALRSQDGYRVAVAASMNEVKARLDEMVEAAPLRRINLDKDRS